MNETVQDLWTFDEVRQGLGVSRATLYRWIEGGLPSVGAGQARRFDPEAVMLWLEPD